MAKGNRKAWSKRDFELATVRKIQYPVHRTVKQAHAAKRERRRLENKKFNNVAFGVSE